MAENNPLDSGTAGSAEPDSSQDSLDDAVRAVGYDGSGDGRLPDLLREAGYDPSVWDPEPEYEAERYNDYIADQEIPGPTPRAGGPLWIGEEIVRLVDEANKIPAQLADIVETHNLRNADWLLLPGIEGGGWLPIAPYPGEYGKREESMLEAVNAIVERSVDAVDAARLVDYACATNILREIDQAQGTNYLHSVEGYRQAAIARNRSVEADSGISADSAVQETVQPTVEIGNDPGSGLPPADNPFVAREFRLDQLDLSSDDREAEADAAVSESSVDLDKEPAREVPVDSGVRVDPIAAGAARPGTQSVPQPDQRVHDIASWLHNANLRARAGEAVKPPKPIKEVLGHFKSAPIDQTRIQILAAAAAARTLEGEQSANAQRLNKLVVETQTRLNAIRDHERRTAALEHREKETPREKIAEWDQNRIDRESANDRNVFNAAAAVAAGYVAARGLPAHDQLAQLADEQLGPVPEAPAPAPDKTPQPEKHSGPSKAGQIKNVLDSAGRGLAQAVGPVAGDDEVAPNLSPVNLHQVTEELAQLAASIAPAMKAAMGSHPRSVKELLNIVQTPDEESDLAFEQHTGLGVERERETEHAV
ncbi:hypothetical protein ACKAMS_26820 [Rhodococcus sp. 5A-K4]|uniref:hypothetical protein n=1 Tax=Rhodococcus sp. 5A-K4 TaxID=3384442 RepID=UPI002AA5C446